MSTGGFSVPACDRPNITKSQSAPSLPNFKSILPEAPPVLLCFALLPLGRGVAFPTFYLTNSSMAALFQHSARGKLGARREKEGLAPRQMRFGSQLTLRMLLFAYGAASWQAGCCSEQPNYQGRPELFLESKSSRPGFIGENSPLWFNRAWRKHWVPVAAQEPWHRQQLNLPPLSSHPAYTVVVYRKR